jgi:hypothetical protein
MVAVGVTVNLIASCHVRVSDWDAAGVYDRDAVGVHNANTAHRSHLEARSGLMLTAPAAETSRI